MLTEREKYTLIMSQRAQKQLNKLPNDVAKRLMVTINSLCDNPRPQGHKKLESREDYSTS